MSKLCESPSAHELGEILFQDFTEIEIVTFVEVHKAGEFRVEPLAPSCLEFLVRFAGNHFSFTCSLVIGFLFSLHQQSKHCFFEPSYPTDLFQTIQAERLKTLLSMMIAVQEWPQS